VRRLVALMVLALATAACTTGPATGTGPGATASPSPSASVSVSPSPGATTQVTVYYLVASPKKVYLAPERHGVGRTAAIAKAALDELVHGTAQDPDHTTPYPRESTINSVTIAAGVATVDWNADVLAASVGSETEALAIQEVVYTLTGFPPISKVRFTVEGRDRGTASNGRTIEDWWGHAGLEGQPWARAGALDVLAPIALYSPLEGESSAGTLTLSGEASTFEATVAIALRDASGTVVVRTSATATEAAPARGTFAKTIRFSQPGAAQTWILQVFETSAEDGSVRFMEDRHIRVG